MGIVYACSQCGGTAVTRDAWAEWSVADQAWVLNAVFDFAFCHECHRPAQLVTAPASVASPAPPAGD